MLLTAVQAPADVLETHARLGNLVEERALQKKERSFYFRSALLSRGSPASLHDDSGVADDGIAIAGDVA